MYTLCMDEKQAEDMARAYDLVEEIWTEGQPPAPDWVRVRGLASELAELAQRIEGWAK